MFISTSYYMLLIIIIIICIANDIFILYFLPIRPYSVSEFPLVFMAIQLTSLTIRRFGVGFIAGGPFFMQTVNNSNECLHVCTEFISVTEWSITYTPILRQNNR